MKIPAVLRASLSVLVGVVAAAATLVVTSYVGWILVLHWAHR